jgi:hypothetical protein
MTDSGLKLKKYIYYAIVALVALSAFLFLLYLWFNIMPWEALGKILLSLGVIAAVLVIFVIVRNDLQDEEKMRKDKYMD